MSDGGSDLRIGIEMAPTAVSDRAASCTFALYGKAITMVRCRT